MWGKAQAFINRGDFTRLVYDTSTNGMLEELLKYNWRPTFLLLEHVDIGQDVIDALDNMSIEEINLFAGRHGLNYIVIE
ncbi:hypothetical protein [Paenibacillus agilis]|uniref:Uncharacterized protein n=1 Tax=Paenibacillus agilis TaxID=3020863 RepID=A0A559ID78_9BACL|nr:hypothetical protein [Paenibacillus agilis]TVX85585.1 hypothetical protein FPZ44_24835 [Paenibacillus agilis]